MSRIKSLVFFVVVSAIFQATPSFAQQQQVFDAKVPFEFSAGDKTLPAGEYRITRHNAFLSVENRQDYSSALVMASEANSSSDGGSRVVFDRVNESFFLRGIVTPAGGIELAVSRSEKKATKEQRRLSTASLAVTTIPAVAAGGR